MARTAGNGALAACTCVWERVRGPSCVAGLGDQSTLECESEQVGSFKVRDPIGVPFRRVPPGGHRLGIHGREDLPFEPCCATVLGYHSALEVANLDDLLRSCGLPVYAESRGEGQAALQDHTRSLPAALGFHSARQCESRAASLRGGLKGPYHFSAYFWRFPADDMIRGLHGRENPPFEPRSAILLEITLPGRKMNPDSCCGLPGVQGPKPIKFIIPQIAGRPNMCAWE